MNNPRLYTASNLRNAPLLRALRAEWTEITFTARWLDESANYRNGSIDEICRAAWVGNTQDVFASDYILVYADPNLDLRGGLFEAGMGVAFAKPIFIVGSHKHYGTWQYHPLVTRLPTFDSVRAVINAQYPNR